MNLPKAEDDRVAPMRGDLSAEQEQAIVPGTPDEAPERIAVCIENVKKSFGGVHALQRINLKVRSGTIHALVGENGAGKSTLMNILAGIHQRDSGVVKIDGKTVAFDSPSSSLQAGIAIIHQELAIAPDLTVAENMFLGNLGMGSLFVPWAELNRKAKEALTAFGFDIDPKTICGELSIAYQQIVEIAKSLVVNNSHILILDEPTAVLAAPEVDILFGNLRRLRENGVTIIYISHRLEEIFRIADAITVIKDGQTVTDLDPRVCSEDDVISNMVGRKLESLFPDKPSLPPDPSLALEVTGLRRNGVLGDINIKVHKGEIVGLAGLVGSGRSEVFRAVFGIDKIDAGSIKKHGQPLQIRCPRDAIRNGIALVPEDRKGQGGVLPMSISTNITMSNMRSSSRFGVLRKRAERNTSKALQEKLRIRLGQLSDALTSLSGGNQQKVVLAKWLNADCDVLLLDEPTRGVDVGAKVEIYNIVAELAARGYGVVMVSSELIEIVGLCHRVYVMSDGNVAGELSGGDITEDNIMRLAIPKRK